MLFFDENKNQRKIMRFSLFWHRKIFLVLIIKLKFNNFPVFSSTILFFQISAPGRIQNTLPFVAFSDLIKNQYNFVKRAHQLMRILMKFYDFVAKFLKYFRNCSSTAQMQLFSVSCVHFVQFPGLQPLTSCCPQL